MRALFVRHLSFRRRIVALATLPILALASCAGAAPESGDGGGTLVIAMTAANLPGTSAGSFESEGWEGERFVGLQLYEGLTRFNLQSDSENPKVEPALATSWTVSEDKLTWTFQLREGVKFQDDTPWNADAAVFGFDRLLDQDFEYYDEADAGLLAYYSSTIASYRKRGDMTFEVTTKSPYAFLTQDLPFLVFPSPTAIKAKGEAFADEPVGTGPFRLESKVTGQQLTMVPNTNYWDGAPKIDRVIVRPIPDATDRVAALRSGEVNWIEFPSPDDVQSLSDSGFQILQNPYSHIWPWIFDTTKGPLKDARVRQALNLAIDRNQLSKEILQGTGVPAQQYIPQTDIGFDEKNNTLTYDPDRAKELLSEAGYPDGFSMTVAYPTSGSGNMVPGPMNEFLQANLQKIGVSVELIPLEWASLLGDYYAGKISANADAVCISLGFLPADAWQLYFSSNSPYNVGHYSNKEVDQMIADAYGIFEADAQAAAFQDINAHLVKDAPWLVVVSDNNPRALAPDVHGFVQPRAVWVDLTEVTVG